MALWEEGDVGEEAEFEAWKEAKRRSLQEQQRKGVALWEEESDSDDDDNELGAGIRAGVAAAKAAAAMAGAGSQKRRRVSLQALIGLPNAWRRDIRRRV